MTTTTTHAPELNSGIWTSWLPVTTAYPSQAGCQTDAWARSGIQVTNSLWPYIYDPAYDASVANSLTCLPPAATSWWNGGTTVDGTITSYSLGPVTCPEAYETVSTSVVSGAGGESTSVICCPTSFVFVRDLVNNPGVDGVCSSILSSGYVFAYAAPAANSYISVTTTLTSAMPLIAVPVEGYNFAVTTTSSPTSSSPSTLPTLGSSLPTSLTPTASSGAPKNTSTPSSGLSSTTKTGLGVGVGVGGLALIIAAVLAFDFRRKRKHAQAPMEELDGDNKNGNFVVANNGLHEMGVRNNGLPVHEMDVGTNGLPVHEMNGNSKPVELPGRYV